MGGKPYQSKGCRTCRKRKIKCDEGKPECRLCLKRGLPCMGYEDQTLFRSSSMKRSVKKKEEKRKTIPPALPSPPPIPSMPSPPSIHPASRVLSISEPVQYWPSMYPEIIASFMEASYPARKPNSSITLSHFLMSEIVSLPNKGDMVEKAICALACVFMGRHEANHQLLVHGVSLYNSAIRSLATMLCRNPSHEDIVYTTYIFQEIEGHYCPHGLEKWITHVMGLSASLKSCQDQHMHTQNPIIQRIYNQHQKLNIIFSTSGIGLNDIELGYLMEPTNGNPILELAQTMAKIGSIVTDFNTLDYSNEPACTELIARCSKIEAGLVKLCVGGYFGFSPTECFSGEFDSPGIPETETLFGTAYRFSSPDNAILHLMFWTQLCILHSLIHQVSSLMVGSDYPSPPGSPSYDQNFTMAEVYADMVVRATPYCLQASMKSICMRFTLYVIHLVSRFYISTSNREKFDWTLHVHRRVSQSGLDFGTYLTELIEETWDRQEGTSLGGEICLSLREEIFMNIPSRQERSNSLDGLGIVGFEQY